MWVKFIDLKLWGRGTETQLQMQGENIVGENINNLT